MASLDIFEDNGLLYVIKSSELRPNGSAQTSQFMTRETSIKMCLTQMILCFEEKLESFLPGEFIF